MHWLLFILGLIMGSFYNVLIWRIPRHESIIKPRSHCPHCSHVLRAAELIPVVSFLWQRGRCKCCQARISWQYPLVELLTGFVFVLCGVTTVNWQVLIVRLVFFSLLLIISVIDWQLQLIPNVLSLSGIIIGFIFSIVGWSVSWLQSMLGAVIGGGILLLIVIVSRGGMGMGDVKLLAMIGTFLGPLSTLYALFVASLCGTVWGVIYLLVTKQARSTPIPFGPFLALGAAFISIILL